MDRRVGAGSKPRTTQSSLQPHISSIFFPTFLLNVKMACLLAAVPVSVSLPFAHSDPVTHTKMDSAQRELWEEGQGGGVSCSSSASQLLLPSLHECWGYRRSLHRVCCLPGCSEPYTGHWKMAGWVKRIRVSLGPVCVSRFCVQSGCDGRHPVAEKGEGTDGALGLSF